MEDILGTELVKKDLNVQSTAAALEGKDFVALYFGAHWAPCCRRFTTTLMEKYTEINAAGNKFEVVFVSKDGNQAAFDSNFGNEMNWLAIKYDDEARKKSLEQKFSIMEIPMLIVLDKTGHQISQNGINDLQNNQPGELLEYWEKMKEE